MFALNTIIVYKHVLCLYFSTADADFVTLVRNITFNSGEIRNTFTVEINVDDIAENDEVFEVVLKSLPDSPRVTIGEPSVATGTIIDDQIPSKIFYNRFLFYIHFCCL